MVRTGEHEGDAAFVERLRRRDDAAFVHLVTRHQAMLARLAWTYVPDPAIVEEVVQETWLGVLGGLDRFEGRSSLTTWLVAILINGARRRARQERRSRPFSRFASPDADRDGAAGDPAQFLPVAHRWERDGKWLAHAREPTPDEAALLAELREHIMAAIAMLPCAQQQVIRLRDVEGWSAADVCQVLALSAANQRVLLHRARAKVRHALAASSAGAVGIECAPAQPPQRPAQGGFP